MGENILRCGKCGYRLTPKEFAAEMRRDPAAVQSMWESKKCLRCEGEMSMTAGNGRSIRVNRKLLIIPGALLGALAIVVGALALMARMYGLSTIRGRVTTQEATAVTRIRVALLEGMEGESSDLTDFLDPQVVFVVDQSGKSLRRWSVADSNGQFHFGRVRSMPHTIGGLVEFDDGRICQTNKYNLTPTIGTYDVDLASLADLCWHPRRQSDGADKKVEQNHPRCEVALGEAAVHGALEGEVVGRIIRRHINELKYCYETALTTTSELAGRVLVKFTVAATGSVIASVLQNSTIGSTRIENCVVQAVRRWEFPKPNNGRPAVVSYPFDFRLQSSETTMETQVSPRTGSK